VSDCGSPVFLPERKIQHRSSAIVPDAARKLRIEQADERDGIENGIE